MKGVPFSGAGSVYRVEAEVLLEALDKDVLYKSRWKLNDKGDSWLEYLMKDENIVPALQARAVWGYFNAYREKEGLYLADGIYWSFPQVRSRRLSDAFPSREEGGGILPMMALNIGGDIVKLLAQYYEKTDYTEYFLLQGLAAELTETLAALVHGEIRRELGLSGCRRRSFGYPECPDLRYQKDLLRLVGAGRIDMRLSASYQLIPEFAVTAIIVPEKEQGKE
jgi:5-methyltetrahydrofolate--homocysteine methyltransferase